jgi:hypothetical protein
MSEGLELLGSSFEMSSLFEVSEAGCEASGSAASSADASSESATSSSNSNSSDSGKPHRRPGRFDATPTDLSDIPPR